MQKRINERYLYVGIMCVVEVDENNYIIDYKIPEERPYRILGTYYSNDFFKTFVDIFDGKKYHFLYSIKNKRTGKIAFINIYNLFSIRGQDRRKPYFFKLSQLKDLENYLNEINSKDEKMHEMINKINSIQNEHEKEIMFNELISLLIASVNEYGEIKGKTRVLER